MTGELKVVISHKNEEDKSFIGTYFHRVTHYTLSLHV